MNNIFIKLVAIALIVNLNSLSLTAQTTNLYPPTGNVGIGTVSPTALLHVNLGNIKISNPAGYPYGFNMDLNFTGAWAREYSISYLGTGKLLSFGAYGTNGILNYGYIGGSTTADAANATPWMVFKPNGFIGIGTVSPVAKLNIESADSTADHMVRLENKGISNSLLYLGTAGVSNPVTTFRKANVIESYKDLHISAANANSNIYLETGRTAASAPVRMIINNLGNVGIGTLVTNGYKLAVNGTIGARRVKVEQTAWADFVFQPDFNLPSLQHVENYIKANQHLPGIPSAKEVAESGLDLGEMNKRLLQKVEELTLYIIELKKESDRHSLRIKKMEDSTH